MLRPEDAQRFELRRPRRAWGAAALLGLVGLTLVASSIREGSPDVQQLLLLVGVVFTILYFVLGIGRRAPPETIEVSPRVLRLPFGASSVEVPLDEIEGLALEEGNRPGLFVSTQRFVVFFPRARFGSAEVARAAHEAIKSRIAQLPGGPQRVAALDTSQLPELGPARRPWGSEGLIVLFAVGVVALIALGGASVERPLEILRLGANARALVTAGEWWRVPASVFIHGDPIHYLLVAMSLFGLGVASERLLGTAGFLVVFAGSAVAGALSSAAFPEGLPFTAGASGGVFGLLGSLLYSFWRFRGHIPLRFQIPERTWFGMLAINFVLPLMVTVVDGAMHLGGLVVGILLTMVVVGDARALPLLHPSLTTRALLVGLGGLYAAALGLVVRSYDVDVRLRQLAVVRALANVESPEPQFLNLVAWSYALSRDATSDELAVAERLAERAVDVRDDFTFRDTWATLAFRRGDVVRAVELQLEAITDERAARRNAGPAAKPSDVLLVSQLARFLAEANARRGVLHRVEGAPPITVSQAEGRVVLHTADAVRRPMSVWVLARERGELTGIGRYPLLPSSGPTRVEPRESIAWARTASLTVALVASGTVTAQAWPMDASVLAYPGPSEVD